MTTRHLVNADGSFAGSYDGPDGQNPPWFTADMVEVPDAPEHADQVWSGAAWSAVPVPAPEPITVEELAALLLTKGTILQGDIDTEIGKRP